MISRGKMLALVAPGAIAFNVSATPWMVEGPTAKAWPQTTSAVPGCSSTRVDRLGQSTLQTAPYFSTKARSIT
ncbi:MAG: hypothetical protein WC023_14125 [Rhodocyclaceae bacterium]